MNNLKIKYNGQQYRTILIHLTCWAVFVCYELILVYYSYKKFNSFDEYLYFYSLNIAFFYLHVKALQYTFADKTKGHLFKGPLLIFLLFSFTLLIKFISTYIFEGSLPKSLDQFEDYKAVLVSNLYRTGYFATLATFYWVADHTARYRKQFLEAEKKQLMIQRDKSNVEIQLSQTRNAFLQQQINPHMLFNALNFIYNCVYKHSPEASRTVLLLSDIMRFSLDAVGADGKTSLEKEVEQIQNLVEINRQRYDEPLFLELQIQENLGTYQIIPLILFTLTENLFKHGNLLMEKYPALIQISVNENGHLYYFTRNLIISRSNFQLHNQIGIQNIRTRMDFSYPGRYDLNLSDTGIFFETSLNVVL